MKLTQNRMIHAIVIPCYMGPKRVCHSLARTTAWHLHAELTPTNSIVDSKKANVHEALLGGVWVHETSLTCFN
jgi:hypothetical protein